MKRHVGSLLFSMGMLALMSSCASIFSSSMATVLLDGDIADTLTVATSASTYEGVVLPQQVELKRNRLTEPILVYQDSALIDTIVPGKKTNPTTYLNLLSPLFAGFAVDAATGSINQPRYDSYTVRRNRNGVDLPSEHSKGPLAWYRFEIGATIGFGESPSTQKLDDLTTTIENAGLRFNDDYNCGFSLRSYLGLRMFYHIDPHVAVGLLMGHFGYSYSMAKFEGEGADEEIVEGGDARIQSNYLIPSVKWTWKYFDNKFGLYSAAGLGVQRRHLYYDTYEKSSLHGKYDERTTKLAYQLTFVGLEMPCQRMNFFAEFGWGMNGIFNVGLNLKFLRGK